MRVLSALLAAMAVVLSASARADDRDFCADRPGRGTPPCTLQPGDVMLEVGAVSLEREADALSTTDTLSLANSLLRVGVDDKTELQIGLAGYTSAKSRDRVSGDVSRARGFGDSYLAVKRGLAAANGPVAVEAFVTLPTGHAPAGAGDWGAGVILPFQHDLPAGFQLALTPEVDAAVNASGHGRHLAFGGVAGLSHALDKALSASGEIAAFQDQDPAGHALDARLAGSLAWQVARKLQLDFETDLGVTHAAPKEAFLFGFAVRI
jgi:hypothetical protein